MSYIYRSGNRILKSTDKICSFDTWKNKISSFPFIQCYFENNLSGTDSSFGLTYSGSGVTLEYDTGKIGQGIVIGDTEYSYSPYYYGGNESMVFSEETYMSGCLWLKYKGEGNEYADILHFYDPGEDYTHLFIGMNTSGGIYLRRFSEDLNPKNEYPWTSDPSVLYDGIFHFIGFTCDSNYYNVWFDGEKVLENYEYNNTLYVNADYVVVGSYSITGAINTFNGIIDQLRIYQTKISDKEMDIIWNSGYGI